MFFKKGLSTVITKESGALLIRLETKFFGNEPKLDRGLITTPSIRKSSEEISSKLLTLCKCS